MRGDPAAPPAPAPAAARRSAETAARPLGRDGAGHSGAAPALDLTVAVCTRDRVRQLRRALASLAALSPAPAEVLVVDNAPADVAARELVGREFPAFRYLVEPVPGLDFARNRALASAARKVVAFLDDDAVAEPGWAGAIRAAFDDAAVAACMGRVEPLELETEGQRLIHANGAWEWGRERVRVGAARGRPLRGRRVPLIAWSLSLGNGCSLAVRRSSALELGGFDEALDLGGHLPGGGDLDMVWRLLEAGGEIVYEPAALARHEHRRGFDAAVDQLAGHQRATVAFLVKSAARARGRRRLGVLAFLAWRLLKPGVRLGRRAAGRDPLPAPVLARMWRESWRGLRAYGAGLREARRRRSRAA